MIVVIICTMYNVHPYAGEELIWLMELALTTLEHNKKYLNLPVKQFENCFDHIFVLYITKPKKNKTSNVLVIVLNVIC